MKRLKITVFTENINYAKALAKGLCYQSSGVEVMLATSQEMAEMALTADNVLITDRDAPWKRPVVLLSDEKTQVDGECPNKKISTKSPVKAILNEAAELAFKNTGDVFCSASQIKTKIWEVYSKQGGSGVTSISLTIAALLAGRSGEKTLYINLSGWDDYEAYVDADFEKTFPKAQFICATEMAWPIASEGYFAEDSHGVHYFKPESTGNSFLEGADLSKIICALEENQNFSDVILDSGKRAEVICRDADIKIKVSECRGDKLLPEADKNCTELANFSSREGTSAGYFHIPEDRESFEAEPEAKSISLYGRFAEQLDRFLKERLTN